MQLINEKLFFLSISFLQKFSIPAKGTLADLPYLVWTHERLRCSDNYSRFRSSEYSRYVISVSVRVRRDEGSGPSGLFAPASSNFNKKFEFCNLWLLAI